LDYASKLLPFCLLQTDAPKKLIYESFSKKYRFISGFNSRLFGFDRVQYVGNRFGQQRFDRAREFERRLEHDGKIEGQLSAAAVGDHDVGRESARRNVVQV
jgi:hypothetical protein